jgi:hypothetical protein
MTRAILVYCGFLALLASCTQRMICPAYQSAFIYDKDELRKKFSYFEFDTVPKVFSASKTKYLIAEPTTYKKKVRSLQTVPAKKVMVHVPDSLSGKAKSDTAITADLDRAARSIIEDDSIISDTVQRARVIDEDSALYVISKDKEVRVLKYNMPDSMEYDSVTNRYVAQKPKYYVDQVRFNTEQDSYMWYLRHSLVLPDVRLAKTQGDKKDEGGEKTAKKEKRGFFKNLFRKKEHDIDSAELEIPPEGEEEFDFIDTTEQESPEFVDQPEKKKGILSRRKDRGNDAALDDSTPGDKPKKRKKKKGQKPDTQPKDEKKKAEDEDDGF